MTSWPAAVLMFAAALAIVWRIKGAWVTPAVVVAGGAGGWWLL